MRLIGLAVVLADTLLLVNEWSEEWSRLRWGPGGRPGRNPTDSRGRGGELLRDKYPCTVRWGSEAGPPRSSVSRLNGSCRGRRCEVTSNKTAPIVAGKRAC
jgi:hypothetical protein